jgi:hypothetical protein
MAPPSRWGTSTTGHLSARANGQTLRAPPHERKASIDAMPDHGDWPASRLRTLDQTLLTTQGKWALTTVPEDVAGAVARPASRVQCGAPGVMRSAL